MNENINIPEVRAKIADYLATHDLPVGVGDENSACSIAAINLAITGRVTDGLHPCMCPIIMAWTIKTQDRMPSEIRNSEAWKSLVPLIAGSRKPEAEKSRMDFIMSEMWRSLEMIQPTADRLGFGAEWRAMTTQKTADYCRLARKAAYAAAYAYDAAAAYATAATAAAAAAYDAAYATAATAAAAAAYDAAYDAAATAAYDATASASASAYASAYAYDAWEKINPCKTLEALLKL